VKTLDEKMMARALGLARKAWGRTSPNPMVGAVVSRGERIIAEGYHARAGEAHAEAQALALAGSQARGATLYVTLEPCHHQGRTPPCTRTVLASGVRRVVIGARDPNPHVTGGGASFLAERGLEVLVGVLEPACRDLNLFFNKHVTTGRPYVILKAASTLDGRLATATGDSRWVTGEKARAHVHYLRSGVDAILVGRGTAEQDDPRLNARLPGRRAGLGKNPLRVVLDTRLSLPLGLKLFDPDAGGPTIVVCGPRPPAARAKTLEKAGVEVLPLPLEKSRPSLARLLDVLGSRNVQSLMIEGGAEVNAAALLGERIVDRVLLFLAPKVVGGQGTPLVGGPGVKRMADALPLEILKLRRFGPDLLLEARPLYNSASPMSENGRG
jgi:diaminohydroxyphosphoribosylaminopyrimidine deaminase/5-amino-6-(5-phosphoribosylamino)uracil reductase